ncbi:hypothetical protein ACFX2K_007783 [Malus domestica]
MLLSPTNPFTSPKTTWVGKQLKEVLAELLTANHSSSGTMLPENFNTSFTIRFEWHPTTPPPTPPPPPPPGALGVGSSMGLSVNSSVENVTEPSNKYPFLAVEFDTSWSSRPTVEDPDFGHVGIDINSV